MKKFSNKLILFGRIIIFIAPFLLAWFYRLIYNDEFLYDYRYGNMRALEMMLSVKPMVILGGWWYYLYKEKRKMKTFCFSHSHGFALS